MDSLHALVISNWGFVGYNPLAPQSKAPTLAFDLLTPPNMSQKKFQVTIFLYCKSNAFCPLFSAPREAVHGTVKRQQFDELQV